MFFFIQKSNKKKSFLIWLILVLIFFSVSTQAFFDFFDDNLPHTPEVKRTPVVSLLVEESLLDNKDLKERIGQYALNVQKKINGQVVQLPVPKDASPLDIFEGNAHLYFSGFNADGKSQLVGTVLIGDIPLPIVEKNGALWPTIFPYTDIERPSYLWNEASQRFIYNPKGDHEPEIWHGHIYSDTNGGKNITDQEEADELRDKELIAYFDQNHLVHTGTTTYGKRVLFVDLLLQKEGLNTTLRSYYNTWVNNIEDILYSRFNKHWAQSILATENLENTVPWGLLSESAKPKSIPNNSEKTSGLPDIQSKLLIEKFIRPYSSAWADYLDILYERIKKAGRWDATQIDTTISLVTRKDMASAILLKGMNDTLEAKLNELLSSNNVAASISVPKITDDYFTGGAQLEGQTLYWNGVDRTNLTTENCSLLRGVTKDNTHPYAQLVETNRTFNIDTVDSCASGYAGCCADNLEIDSSTLRYSIKTSGSPPNIVSACSVTQATLPIFDLAGTREVTSGNQGASGCIDIINTDNEDPDRTHRFDSLMIHNEPRVTTIDTQVQSMKTIAIPVDDPRGFSFYDHSKTFYRLSYFNLFDMRDYFKSSSDVTRQTLLKQEILNQLGTKIQEINTIINTANTASNARLAADRLLNWPGSPAGGTCSYSQIETNPDSFTTKIEWTETCVAPISSEKIVRYYETATTLSEDVLKNLIQSLDIDKVTESIVWLDKDLSNKNRTVLEKALSTTSVFQDFFFDASFNGYEFVEIIGEKAEDKIQENKGILSTFEQGESEDGDYELSKRESNKFQTKEKKRNTFLGFDFKKIFVKTDENTPDKKIIHEDVNGETKITTKNNAASSESFVRSIQVIPSEIKQSSTDLTPIDVEITLKDKNDHFLSSDFSSQVTLQFSSNDASRFFTILPAKTQTVTKGKATFQILPKGETFGGKLTLSATVGKRSSDPVPITLTPFSLLTNISRKEIPVKNSEGSLITVKVQDQNQNLSRVKDNTLIRFTSDWGNFSKNGYTRIQDGKASIQFYPGTKAGQAKIRIETLDETVAPQFENLIILPEKPLRLTIKTASNFLIPEGDFIPVEAILTDLYGNKVSTEIYEFIWKTENANTKPLLNKDSSTLLIQPSGTNLDVLAEVYVKSIPSLRAEKRFPTTINPKIDIQASSTEILAGSDAPISLLLTTKTSQNQKINTNFTADIFISPADLGEIVPSITFENGQALLEFFPGTKSRQGQIQIQIPGFEKTIFDLEILPEKAEKINLSVDKNTINRTDETDLNLTIEIVDQFGNIATDFKGEVALAFNEAEIRTESQNDVLVTLGVFGEVSNQKAYIDENINTTVGSQASDKDLLTISGGNLVRPEKGKKTVEVTSSTKTGQVFLTAKSEGLIPGVVEFEVIDYLTVSDIETLNPKSLLTLFLNFEAGDKSTEKSFANRYLMSGNSQAVGALLNDPDPFARKGFIDTSGEVSKDLKIHIEPGPFLEMKLQNSDKIQTTTRLNVVPNAPLALVTEKQNKPGVYFLIDPKQKDDFTKKENTILFQEKPLITLQSNGGITLEISKIELKPTPIHSLFEWDVLIDEKTQAKFLIIPSFSTITAIDDITESGTRPGIWVQSLSSEYQIVPGLTGKSTNEDLGVFFVSTTTKEDTERLLGSPRHSIEDIQINEDLVWEGLWKPGTFLGAGNSIGQSNLWGSSDAFILLGDPSLNIANDNTRSSIGIQPDIGKQIWKSPVGNIDQILVLDINGDGNGDILNRVGKEVYALYQDDEQLDNFRSIGPILRFSDGVKTLASFDNDFDGFWELLQLNEAGQTFIHKNTNGTFHRQSIDLGIPNTILRIEDAKLNTDEFRDLFVLDDKNCTWKILGQKNGFNKPQNLACLNPDFVKIEETFTVADNQDPNDPYFTPTKFSHLNHWLVSFNGIENDLKDDPDQIRYLTTFETERTPFVPFSKNKQIDTNLKITQIQEKEDPKLQEGDTIDIELEIESQQKLTNVQFIPSKFEGFAFVENSLQCDVCTKPIALKPRTPEGLWWAWDIQIPAKEKITITWKMKVSDIPPIRYSIDDYYGKDDVDDIVIPWQTSNDQQILRLPSNSNPAHNLEIENIPVVAPIDQTSFLASQTDTQLSNGITSGIKADSDSDGYPNLYDGPGIGDDMDFTVNGISNAISEHMNTLNNEKESTECPQNDGLPLIPEVFLAPGFTPTYTPPITVPGGFDGGTPAFWIPPSPISSVQTSAMRFYVMPSTTGKVSFATCFGSYPSSIVSPLWNANCFTMAPPNLPKKCMGQIAPTIKKLKENLFSYSDQPWNQGSMEPKADPTITNQQISGVDVISTWLQDQYREFGNSSLPSLNVKSPDLNLEKSDQDQDVIQALSESPFVNLQQEQRLIPYANVSEESLEKMKKDYAEWNDHFQSWEKDGQEKISSFEQDIKTAESEGKDTSNEREILVNAKAHLKEGQNTAFAVEQKMKTVENYKDQQDVLLTIPSQVTAILEEVLQHANTMSEYFKSVNDSVTSSLNEWETFRDTSEPIVKSWEAVPDTLKSFIKSYPSSQVDRGSMQEWLLRIFLSGVELPIIGAPNLPNVNLDISEMTFGFDIIAPQIQFEPVDMAIFEIPPKLEPFPRLPDINDSESFTPHSSNIGDTLLTTTISQESAIPNVDSPRAFPTQKSAFPTTSVDFQPMPPVQKLPEMPSIDFNVQVPELELPSIPEIPSPPAPPNAPDVPSPTASPNTPNISDIPDSPNTPDIPDAPSVPEMPSIPDVLSPIETIMEIPKALLPLMGLLKTGIAPVPEWYLKGYTTQLTNRTDIMGLDFAPGALSPVPAKTTTPPEINIKVEHDFVPELKQLSDTVNILEETFRCVVEGIRSSTKGDQDSSECSTQGEPISQKKSRSFAFLELLKRGPNIITSLGTAKLRNWLATNVAIDEIAQSLPSNFNATTFETTRNATPKKNDGIYYYDANTDTAELITKFPMTPPMTATFADLGTDGNEEIIYSLGEELYLKYRVVPDAKVREDEEKDEWEALFDDFIQWSFEEWKEKFSPTQKLISDTNVDGSNINFERLSENISYFEWVLSERPDNIFEIGDKAEDRKSNQWQRTAFIIREKPPLYEIRPKTSQVSTIKGSPILYAAPEEEVPKMSQSDCEDPDIIKPFYPTESILVGVGRSSRMEIRVPPRAGQEEEFREIVLRSGEETVVEYAEICLTRGKIKRISTQDQVKGNARKGIYLPSGSRFELGPKERIDLTIFDGTTITIEGNETYEIYYFETQEEAIDHFKYLQSGNYYGFLMAQKGDQKSYFHPSFLHDPQTQADTRPPEIKISGGVTIDTTLFQEIPIDASATIDNDRIQRVWWDTDSTKDSDGDGNFTNDVDFPLANELEKYTPRQLLKISLPGYENPGNYIITLNVEDPAQNQTSQEIKIQAKVPLLKLTESSIRDQKIKGNVESGESNVPIHIMRKRSGEPWETLTKKPILSQPNGHFETSRLGVSEGLKIYDSNEKLIAEILPNGRPIIKDSQYGFIIESATGENPFQIKIRDRRNNPIAFVSFQREKQIPLKTKDTNPDDSFIFQKSSSQKQAFQDAIALVDVSKNKTVGILDQRGDFYVLPPERMFFRIKNGMDGTTPLVFEIFSADKKKRGEFSTTSASKIFLYK